jgi:PAS domain S-box-containing protein
MRNMKFGALKIAGIFLVVGLIWIMVSDKFLFTHDTPNGTFFLFLSKNKALVYVLFTTIALYTLINTYTNQLQESEKQYRGYFENNSTPMWIFNRDTLRFKSVNSAAIKSYGYTSEEFRSMTILDIKPEAEKPKTIEIMGEVPTSVTDKGVWQHIKKDGTLINVHIVAYPLSSRRGNNVMIMATDVTKQLLYEQQLQDANKELNEVNNVLSEQKKLLTQIQRISKLGGWQYYPDTKHQVRSEGIYDILDFTHEYETDPEPNFLDHIHPDDKELYIQTRDLTEKQGISTDTTIRLFDSAGKLHYIHRIAEMEYLGGKQFRINGAIQDITEIKALEEERNTTGDENKKLAEIINKINNMVLLTDEQKNVIWSNRAFAEFTGYKLREIKGKKPGSFLAGPNPDLSLVKTIDNRVANREVFSIELPLYIKKQTSLWVNADFTPLFDAAQQFTGYITIYSDISAIKEKEAGLLKQNKLLREIAWTGSHEVRKPLATLMGLINLLKTTNDEQERRQLYSYIDISTKELDTMLHKINARISEGTV